MRPCGASAASTWASVAPAPARTRHASPSTATARRRFRSTTIAGTTTAAAPMRPLPPPRATSGTPAPAAQRTRAATSAALAGSATASGRVASAASSGRPRDGRRAARPPAASGGPAVGSANAAQTSRTPPSTPIAATLPPPSRSGDGGRPRRSRRRLTRIAREAGSPRTQARPAPRRTRLLRHGEAELVDHDVAGRLAHAARHGLLRPLRPPARRLLHVPPEGLDDARLPLRLGERLDRQLHALAERAGAPAAAAAGGRLQVNLPANLAVRIRGRVDVDVRPAIEQRVDEIGGHRQSGGTPREPVLGERDTDRARRARRRLVDVRGGRGEAG